MNRSRGKFKRYILIAAVLSALLLLYQLTHTETYSKNTKYIAYIGRYTDIKDTLPPQLQKESKFEKMHEVTLKEYIKQIDLPYTHLELKTFDCRKDGEESNRIYQQIANDTNIVAVIDNTWGQDIRHCAGTIRDKGIPVIAINADRNNNDFGTNAIFTGNNDHVPLDIAAFAGKVLKVKEINFISEDDYPLHETYMKAFAGSDIRIKKLFALKGKNFTPADSAAFYQDLDSYYKANPREEETLLVISVHVGIGSKLVNYLDKHFSKLRMLGHTYILNQSSLEKFGQKNDNQLILISNPSDAVTQRLHLDIEKLKSSHPAYFENPNHPMFVERCLDAVEILKNKFEFEKDTTILRKQDFIRFFHSLKNQVVEEEEEIYEFDSLLTMLPELYFTEYSSGKLHSYPLQLNQEREVIPNLFFGMEIVDIYNIDMNENSFTSDFYYWVKLDTANKDAEKFIIFQNMKQHESSKELVFEKTDGATVYKLYKVSGIFYVNYQLKSYPFDEQEIFIRAEILSPSSKLKVSFDQKSFNTETRAIDKFKITEWNKVKFYVTVDNEITRGMHGDPDIDEEKLNEFKNIYFRLNIKRKAVTPMLEIILPLILIGMISISLLFMRDISFAALGEVSIGVFMSIVAFSISFSASTPNSDDLTKADFLFWLTFIVVLLNFMIVIAVNAIYHEEKVKKMDIRRISLLVGVVYFALVTWFLLK